VQPAEFWRGADRVGGWKNHYLRMKRWEVRARAALADMPYTNFGDALDTTLVYFVWCHSLRDWIIKDRIPERDEVTAAMRNSVTWKIIRDLANRTKHFEISQSPTDKDWAVFRELEVFEKHPRGGDKETAFLLFDGKKVQLATVVDDAAKLWDMVLLNSNLL
jgi:hypothetical protein